MPSAHAMQMALTGERIDARRAQRIGLVSEWLARRRCSTARLRWRRRIAGNAPLAVQAIKKLSRQTAH